MRHIGWALPEAIIGEDINGMMLIHEALGVKYDKRKRSTLVDVVSFPAGDGPAPFLQRVSFQSWWATPTLVDTFRGA